MSIKVEGITKSYQLSTNSITILDHLNAEIKKSEVVAILGKSGSGKSTLLSLLGGLDKPDQGDIVIDGVDITKLSYKDLIDYRAQKIGIVFQQFYLVSHLTAYENLALPLDILNRSYSDSEIKSYLDAVGIGHRGHHSPNELSGGESQRLAIARALITRPELLLADEPSGSLDTETGQQVMKVFFEQVRANKTTTLLVTHDNSIADQCDRILRLEKGRFVNS